MVGIVRIALRRPYTFVVLALAILIVGPLAALRTPVDIFPNIRIPVIAVIWQYTGLPPQEMAGRMATLFERALTTTVNDIEHIEATSYTTISVTKVFFQPGVDRGHPRWAWLLTRIWLCAGHDVLRHDLLRHDLGADAR